MWGTFSTDSFEDSYGELDRAGTGDTRRRPPKGPRKYKYLSNQDNPCDYGVNETVGEPRIRNYIFSWLKHNNR